MSANSIKIQVNVEGADSAASSLKAIDEAFDDIGSTASSTNDVFGDVFKGVTLGTLAVKGLEIGLDFLKQAFDFVVDSALAAIDVLSEFAQESVAYAIELEDAWKGVAKVYGDSAQQFDDDFKSILKPAVQELTKEFGFQKLEVLGVVDSFAAMGKTGQDNLELTERSLEFARVGALGLAESTEIVTAVSSIFNVQGQELAETLSILNTVENVGAVSMLDLGRAIARSGSVAKEMGVNINEFSSFINVLKESGVEATFAARGLRTIFVNLRNPTEELESTLLGLNISIEDTNGELKESDDILHEVAGKWDTLSSKQKDAFLVGAAGKDQVDKLATIMSDLSSDTSRYNEVLLKTSDAGANVEAFYNELGIAMDSTSFKQQQLTSIFDEAREIVGEPLQQALSGLLDILTPMAESALPVLIATVDNAKTSIIDWWEDNETIVMPKIETLLSILGGEDGTGGLVGAVTNLFDPTSDANDALQYVASTVAGGMLDNLSGIANTLTNMINFLNENPETIRALGAAFSIVSDSVGKAVSAVNFLISGIQTLIGWTQKLAGALDDIGLSSGTVGALTGVFGSGRSSTTSSLREPASALSAASQSPKSGPFTQQALNAFNGGTTENKDVTINIGTVDSDARVEAVAKAVNQALGAQSNLNMIGA